MNPNMEDVAIYIHMGFVLHTATCDVCSYMSSKTFTDIFVLALIPLKLRE